MTTSKKGDLLIAGDVVYTDPSGIPCTVEQFLGGGGQGEVYRANFQGRQVALKWYFPHTFKYDPYLHERLEQAINTGAPSDRFLWPMELTRAKGKSGFGYIMPLRFHDWASWNNIPSLSHRRFSTSRQFFPTSC
jgi:eukaryotic-like serine/threonine-protein kinase